MREIKVGDFTYKIIDKQELEGAAAVLIYFDSNEIRNKWDLQTVSKVAKEIFDFYESIGIKAIFIPSLFSIESLNDCKTAIEKLSKELYEFSELQDKLLEERERYESF